MELLELTVPSILRQIEYHKDAALMTQEEAILISAVQQFKQDISDLNATIANLQLVIGTILTAIQEIQPQIQAIDAQMVPATPPTTL